MKKKLFIPGLFLILILFLTACNADGHSVEYISTETTAGPDVLPTFLNDLNPEIGKAYQIAANNRDLLEYIPCYCGCGESEGHKNNLDCFIREEKTDGSIVWDVHAVTCNNCQEIAIESADMKNRLGKSVKEIRQAIDAKYKEGYAEPTPTPLPAE